MRALLLGPRDGWAASLVGVNAPLQGGVACPFGVFIHRCAGHGKGRSRIVNDPRTSKPAMSAAGETARRRDPSRDALVSAGNSQVQASIALAAHPTSSVAARNFVGGMLEGWGRGDLLEDAVLLTSEVVTNAIVHAGTDLVVTVGLDGPRARVAVRDDDVTAPRKREPTLESGRGLTLVEALAGSWGTFSYGDGKAVWFEL